MIQSNKCIVWPALVIGLCLTILLVGPASGAIPLQIPYAGQVSVGGTPYTGDGRFKFAIVSQGCQEGGQCLTLWSNDGSSGNGSEPGNAIILAVDQGRFSLGLGDDSLANMLPITPGIFNNELTYLRIWFSDGVNGFELLTPDRQLVSVPYAYRAAKVDTLEPGQAVTSINGARDDIILKAGQNIIINEDNNSVTISASASGGGLATDVQCEGCISSTDLDFTPITQEQLSTEGIAAGAATGGNMGAGTINAEAIFINGHLIQPAISVSGYDTGQIIHVNDSMGSQPEHLYIENTFPSFEWKTIGPSDSGADTLWPALDMIPAEAKTLVLKIMNTISSVPGNGSIHEFYIRKPGSTASADLNTLVSQLNFNILADSPDTGAAIVPSYLLMSTVDTAYAPVSNRTFEIWRYGGDSAPVSGRATIQLLGWIK